MANFAVEWDKVGERFYEIGVDRGMFYPLSGGEYNNGEAWSGLSNVTNKPEGADVNDIWADNMKYLSIRAAEKFGATIECYSYPNGFKACNGEEELATGVTISGQTRKPFGFSYRSRIGNDEEFQDYGYKIHLIYNATASPVEKSYGTINDSTDVDAMSYDVETTGIQVPNVGDKEFKPTSHLEIDSTKVSAAQLSQLEYILYGTEGGADPRMPLPAEVLEIFGGTPTPSVELNKHYIELAAGDEETLIATVKNAGSSGTVTWTPTTGSYATVDSNGKVTAVAEGSAIVTATITVDGIDYNDTCTVKVNEAQANG